MALPAASGIPERRGTARAKSHDPDGRRSRGWLRSDTIGPNDLKLGDLVGIQTAPSSNTPRPTVTSRLIHDNGATGTITLNANGSYTHTLTAPGPITQTVTGAFTVQIGSVLDRPTGQPMHTTIVTRTGDTITILDEAVTFDFDGNPNSEPTEADLTTAWMKGS